MIDDQPIQRRKPSRIANNGFSRDFSEPQEYSKPDLRRMLAEAVKNTAALPVEPKEKRCAKRN